MSEQTPAIGRIVHYQAHGSPDGTHQSLPRAAIVTAVHDHNTVDLCVISPSGFFFNQRCARSDEPKGGTWRWPPRV